jgi:hypothetical protein
MFERGFYNCDCGWSGGALRYEGYGAERRAQSAAQHGQGVCPQCGRVFRGCFHPDVHTQMIAASAQSKERSHE